MRFNLKKQPQSGEQREISVFPIWPRAVGGEVVWLENVKIKQIYEPPNYSEDGYWKDVEIVN